MENVMKDRKIIKIEIPKDISQKIVDVLNGL
jgi:hypothetical protein